MGEKRGAGAGLVYDNNLRILCAREDGWDMSLASVVIRSDVLKIEGGCFDGHESLAEIIFESGSKLRRIEEEVFRYA
jgi:hypothetical protein